MENVVSYISTVIKDAISSRDSKLCIVDGDCPKLTLSYKYYHGEAFYFGDNYYDIRIPEDLKSPRATTLINDISDISTNEIVMAKHYAKEDNLMMIDLYKSNIFIKKYKTNMNVTLSRSLASYESEGIYIDRSILGSKLIERFTESLFHNPDDYFNDEIIAEMLRLLKSQIYTLVENKVYLTYSLCFIRTKDNDKLKFTTSYFFLSSTGRAEITTDIATLIRREIKDAIMSIEYTENHNSPNNKREFKTVDYNNIYQLLEI